MNRHTRAGMAQRRHSRLGRLCLPLGVAFALAGVGSANAANEVIAAAGDIACKPGTSCGHMATSNLLVNQGLSAVLAVGDLQYECAGTSELAGAYDLSWGRVKAITKPVPGNHEYKNTAASGGTGCDDTKNALPYFTYFSTGTALPAGATDPARGYYSYDIGDWHFIALNTGENCAAVPCNASSTQVQWLKADLAAHRNVCTMAYFHYPLFSSNTPLPTYTRPIWDALYAGHADVVLSGHVHHYERFAPQTPSGLRDDATGIRAFNVGTGGIGKEGFKKNYPVDPTDPSYNPLDPATWKTYAPNSEARLSIYGVLKFTLRPTGYDWQLVDDGRAVRDSGSAACNPTGSGGGGTTDTTPPLTSITAPAKDATLSGTVTVKANASDAGGIAAVGFRVDGTSFASDGSSPYQATLDTTKLTNGAHTLTTIATDFAGNTAVSFPVPVTVTNDTVAPTVAITAPAPGAIVRGTVVIDTNPVDNPGGTGVRQVDVSVDGKWLGLSRTAPYAVSWDTTKIPTGAHTISVTATDNGGLKSPPTEITAWVQNVRVAPPGSFGLSTIRRSGTGGTLLVAPVTGSLSDPVYSHNRRRFAYVTPEGIAVAASSGASTRIVPGTAGATHPGWGPNDTSLVFIRNRAIWRIPTVGGTTKTIATGNILSLAVSPDGQRVVYQVLMKNGRSDLFTMAISGKGKRNLTHTLTLSEAQPTWRNRTTVAFAKLAAGTWTINTMPAAGGASTRVTAPGLNCQQPAYSPNGMVLACVTRVSATKNVIRTATWKGTSARNLRIAVSRPKKPTWAASDQITYLSN